VVDVDLGQVAGVIDRLDLLADEGRERGFDIAPWTCNGFAPVT